MKFTLVLVALAILFKQGPRWTFVAEAPWAPVLPVSPEFAADAALDRAWAVLSDVNRYSEWNTFTTGVATEGGLPPQAGLGVELNVSLGYPWPLSSLAPTSRSSLKLQFRWLAVEPENQRQCWGIRNPSTFLDIALAAIRAGTEEDEGAAPKDPSIPGTIMDALIHSNRCAELRYAPDGSSNGPGRGNIEV